MKWKLMILPALLLPVLAAAAPKLVENGRSDYAIVLPQSAIPPEETAARELQSMLKRISGAELPIVRTKPTRAKRSCSAGATGPRSCSESISGNSVPTKS